MTSDVIFPFDAEYAASKSYNEKYSQALTFELKQDNIDVLAIKPLFVSTNMISDLKS